MADDNAWDMTPRIEHRAADDVKTVRCPNCGRDVEPPREEPWIITGQEHHAPQLVSFVCPHCGHDVEASG